ncbi:hypothetical protein BYT27DRAFT_7218574 [Phlegmacium glaucopus]|nr:hypothetical protein BYT27DRAFT_7218574 [Phlegmacium glaucopus]
MLSPRVTSTSTKVIRTGNVHIIERNRFSSATLKPRRLELSTDFLTITNLSSKKRTSLRLCEITQLERSDLADFSLQLVLNLKKHYNLAFASDSELYDWQDDIYKRCPLGNYSAPFGFVHKAHIGSDAVSGTFSDTNILPIYAEITGGPPSVATAPRSRSPPGPPPLSALTIANVPSSTYHKLRLSRPDTLEGLFMTKQTGAGVLARWIWRERQVTLTQTSLIVKASGATQTIALANLTRIEPDLKQQNCLVIQCSTLAFYMLFRDNSELYTWLDALYLRSSLSTPIGSPTNVVHKLHVGFDTLTGGFTGLPADWQAILNSPVSPVPSAAATIGPASSMPDTDRRARRQSRRKSVPVALPSSSA